MTVGRVMLKQVNGYTTGTIIKRGVKGVEAERFFVASKKASNDEIINAVCNLAKHESIPDNRFFYLPNLVPLNGMDIAVVSKTIEDGDKIYTRILPRSVMGESKLSKGLGERSLVVEKDKNTHKNITAVIRPNEKLKQVDRDECGFVCGYYYPYRTFDFYSNGASEEARRSLESRIVENNLF